MSKSRDNNALSRYIGGIVAAVTLAIAVAFIAVMLLVLGQNANTAVDYAEEATNLYSDEVNEQLAAYVESQRVLAASGLTDGDLAKALSLEASADGTSRAASALAPLLEKLVVDKDAGVAFVASGSSHIAYLSDGSVQMPDQGFVPGALIDDIGSSQHGGKMTAIPVTKREGADAQGAPAPFAGHEPIIAMGRPLMQGTTSVGVVGVCLKSTAPADTLEIFHREGDESTVCFAEDGTVLFSSGGSPAAGSDVFSAYPQIADYPQDLRYDETKRWALWTGLEGFFPHDQVFYEVKYSKAYESYVLTVNTAQTVFGEMRERTMTLLLALGVVMVLLILLVVTSVRWYRSRLIKATATDELTGLANRKSFVESFERFMQREDLGEVSLALVDVDFFKQVNDTYGHAEGDRALASVASAMREATAPDGLAGRWGGDEFIGIFHMPPEQAKSRVQAMIEGLAAQELACGAHISVSVGMAQLLAKDSLERAIERADDALYVTKEGGRGFLTVYDPKNTPHMAARLSLGPQASAELATESAQSAGESAEAPEKPEQPPEARGRMLWKLVVEGLLDAVKKMIPFVAGGGILIAVAFLIDAASVDINSLPSADRANFGSITPIAAGLHEVGAAAFNFMLPIFAAFFARALAGDHAFMAGFAGGFLASQGSSGFVGAIFAALISALVVRLMRNFLDETAPMVRRAAPVLIYPVFTLLIMYLFMTFLIDPVTAYLDGLLTSMLQGLAEGNRVLLGGLLGLMMSTDMGGFINKCAYHFGTASIAEGGADIMASVMVGGMVPPCGIALCLLMFKDRFAEEERDLSATTLFLGLSFITEGALPFVLTDVARVIPSCMAGSALAGALSMAYGCTLMAPHGGIFVLPVVGGAPMYFVALLAGSLITALLLGLLKKPAE